MLQAARQEETAVRLAFGGEWSFSGTVCQRPAGEPDKGCGFCFLPCCRRLLLSYENKKVNSREEAHSKQLEHKSKVESAATTLLLCGRQTQRGLDEHLITCDVPN